MELGNFDELAKFYDKGRPAYSVVGLDFIFSNYKKPIQDLVCADIGAGTGIWTRMMSRKNVKELFAVEPSTEMINFGKLNKDFKTEIKWKIGTAESTGLESNKFDLVTMASSFHWTNFDFATKEFHRILTSGGFLCVLWNPRMINTGTALWEIEDYLKRKLPNLKRVSSGYSDFTDSLNSKFEESKFFSSATYREFDFDETMTLEKYITAWRSVNDIQVKLGKNEFEKFIKFIEEKFKGIKTINASYKTRMWLTKVKNKNE
jgi:ubiquinone/menaquinone biosynthesis C-methylase UbiE